MKRLARFSCVAACAAMLGGCQSFPLTSWMFKGKRPATEQRLELAGNTEGTLEEARAQLREGNISAAVASFRIALLEPSTSADASNGLGVAYAKLGRHDLAARYFQAAIAARPDETRYVANLLRLQKQVMLARRASAAHAVAAAQPAPRADPRRDGEPLVAVRVDRVSRGEVMVHAREELGNAPAMAIAYRDAPASESAEVATGPSQAYPAGTALSE